MRGAPFNFDPVLSDQSPFQYVFLLLSVSVLASAEKSEEKAPLASEEKQVTSAEDRYGLRIDCCNGPPPMILQRACSSSDREVRDHGFGSAGIQRQQQVPVYSLPIAPGQTQRIQVRAQLPLNGGNGGSLNVNFPPASQEQRGGESDG